MSKTTTTIKALLRDIKKSFAKNEKIEISTLLTSLISMKYSYKDNIWEYIMETSHLASKLSAFNLTFFKELLVHLVLMSFPT